VIFVGGKPESSKEKNKNETIKKCYRTQAEGKKRTGSKKNE